MKMMMTIMRTLDPEVTDPGRHAESATPESEPETESEPEPEPEQEPEPEIIIDDVVCTWNQDSLSYC